MTQLLLSLFSLTALAMFQSRAELHRRLACWVGLCGQPFWLYETYAAAQWGMLLLSCAYTLVYIFGIVSHYKEGPLNEYV